MTKYRRVLAKNVKMFRSRANWTQDQLAEAAKCEKSTISRIENSKTDPMLKTLYRIAEALDVKPHTLFFNPDIGGEWEEGQVRDLVDFVGEKIKFDLLQHFGSYPECCKPIHRQTEEAAESPSGSPALHPPLYSPKKY